MPLEGTIQRGIHEGAAFSMASRAVGESALGIENSTAPRASASTANTFSFEKRSI